VVQRASGHIDGDQVMTSVQVNNHDQGNMFWTGSQFEDLGPSQICN
jgi:hypothetical protein